MPALTPKSVLEGRSSNRAPVSLIIGLVVSGFCLLIALALYFAMGAPQNVFVGMILALPTTIVLVAAVLWIDRLEPEPRLMLLVAFAWGAGVALLGALIVNTTTESILAVSLGAAPANAVTTTMVAPVVEESFKGSLLLFLLLVRRQEIDGPTDGIVYAAMCGLGFALVENILYYMKGLAQTGDVWGTVLVRGVIAPLGHPMYTSITGLAVAYVATHRGAGRFFVLVFGWFGAVVLHALWNGSLTLAGMPGLVLAYLIEAVVLLGLILVLAVDRRRLVRLIGRYLPAYLPSGLVTPNDLVMLASIPGRRQARAWARSTAGATGAQAMGDYQLAATELALLHSRAEHRTITPERFFARRDAIVGLMRVARDAFFRRQPQAPQPPWARRSQSGFFNLPPQLTELPPHPQGGRPWPPQQGGNQWPPQGGNPRPPQGGNPPQGGHPWPPRGGNPPRW